VASLAGVVMIFSIFGIVFYVWQQHVMKAQVRGMIKEYMPLEINTQGGDTALEQDDDDARGTYT
jgi:hypothetical protein